MKRFLTIALTGSALLFSSQAMAISLTGGTGGVGGSGGTSATMGNGKSSASVSAKARSSGTAPSGLASSKTQSTLQGPDIATRQVPDIGTQSNSLSMPEPVIGATPSTVPSMNGAGNPTYSSNNSYNDISPSSGSPSRGTIIYRGGSYNSVTTSGANSSTTISPGQPKIIRGSLATQQ